MGDQYDEILDRMSDSSDPAFDAVWKALVPATRRDARRLGQNAERQARRQAFDERQQRMMASTMGGPARPRLVPRELPRRQEQAPAPEAPEPAVPEAAEEPPAAPRRPRRSDLPRRSRTPRATSSIPDAVNVASTGRELRPVEERTADLIPRTVLMPVTSSPPEPEAPAPESPARSSSMNIEGSGNISMRNGQLMVNGKEVELDEEGNYSEPGISITPSSDSSSKNREEKIAEAEKLFEGVQQRKREREDREAQREEGPPEATQGEGPITPPKRDKDSSSNLNEQLSAAIQGGDADALRTLLSTKEAEIAETLGTDNLANYKSALEQMESNVAAEAGMEEVKRTSRKRRPPKENPVTQPVETAKKPEVAKPASKTDKRTNAQLREALKAMGLSTKGKKADLLERLNAADSEKAESKPKAAAKTAPKSEGKMTKGKAQSILDKPFKQLEQELGGFSQAEKARADARKFLETPASKEPKVKAAVKGKEPEKKAAKKKADSKKQENVDDELPSVSDKKAAKERTEQEDALSGKAPPPRRSSKKGK